MVSIAPAETRISSVPSGFTPKLAFVLSPKSHEALTYAEAMLDLNEHLDEVRSALGRRGGPRSARRGECAASRACCAPNSAGELRRGLAEKKELTPELDKMLQQTLSDFKAKMWK